MNKPPDIHIDDRFLDYQEVINKIPKKELDNRYERLLESAQKFINEMGYNGHVICNETMLMYSVLGYYSDITRLKNFHKIEKENEPKLIAYEVSWLLKRRPLQLIKNSAHEYIFCNEQFAFSQITFWLKKNEIEKGTEALSHQDLKYFTKALFYHLKYRDYNPQTLELMLLSFIAGRDYQYLLSADLKD
jgi:hypothetical protein